MSDVTWGANAAHGGDGWRPRSGSHHTDLGSLWQLCGAGSECGRLTKVMLHFPGSELAEVSNPLDVDWISLIEPAKARSQITALAEVYERKGVEVFALNPSTDPMPNHVFVRDLFAMTPQGAIISRLAGAARAGEERAAAEALGRFGVPIVFTVHGTATFEGPDVIFFAPGRAFVGISVRSSEEGVKQVKTILEMQGVDVTCIQTVYGCGHLDGIVSLVDRDLAVVYPKRASYTLYQELRRSGYRVVELPSQAEAEEGMAINMVAIEPGLVLIPEGNEITTSFLREQGIRVIATPFSEVMKGGGAIHCATGILHREDCW